MIISRSTIANAVLMVSANQNDSGSSEFNYFTGDNHYFM